MTKNYFELEIAKHDQRTNEAYKRLATRLGCKKSLVKEVFGSLPSPYYSNRPRVKQTLAEKKSILKLANLATRFANETSSLNSKYVNALVARHLDITELENLARKFQVLGDIPPEAPINRKPSKGGKNWAAYEVALGIAELFVRLRRPITFGQTDGQPSTDFGRCVEASFEIFEIEANWRDPARSAMLDTKLAKKT